MVLKETNQSLENNGQKLCLTFPKVTIYSKISVKENMYDDIKYGFTYLASLKKMGRKWSRRSLVNFLLQPQADSESDCVLQSYSSFWVYFLVSESRFHSVKETFSWLGIT